MLSANASPAERAAAEHPFPAAASEGLEPPPIVANPPVGEKQTQVAMTLTNLAPPPATAALPATTAAPPAVAASTAPPPSPPGARDLAHAVGHFFHKLFHPHSQ